MTTIIRENDFGYGGKYIENLPKGNEIYEIKPIKKPYNLTKKEKRYIYNCFLNYGKNKNTIKGTIKEIRDATGVSYQSISVLSQYAKGNNLKIKLNIKKKDFILICKEIGVLHKIEKSHYED